MDVHPDYHSFDLGIFPAAAGLVWAGATRLAKCGDPIADGDEAQQGLQ